MGKHIDSVAVDKAVQSVYNNWIATLRLDGALEATSELHKRLISEMKRRKELKGDHGQKRHKP